MRIHSVTLHKFRSVGDGTFYLYDYSLLVCANNAGKSNVIDALRVFYDQLKYNSDTDFPCFSVDSDDSWIEIEYLLTEKELETLDEKYRRPKGCFKVRKVLANSDKIFSAGVIYGYAGDELETSPMFGIKRGQLKFFGNVIYIPPVSHLAEQTKLTGPSPLRDLVYMVVNELVDSSEALQGLTAQFETFGKDFKHEQTAQLRSIAGLEQDINAEIAEWDMEFSLVINPITKSDLVKNLVSLEVHDKTLGAGQNPSQFGHGFQRHLIFTLIRMVAQYQSQGSDQVSEDFGADFTLILFEEPEAFLHPTQQAVLYDNLIEVSENDNIQVLITTHSPNFVSFNSEHITAIVRLSREDGHTRIGQLRPAQMRQILRDNQQINAILKERHDDAPEDLTEVAEAVRYFLWLGTDRCGMFFAGRVLLVEGPTERILVDYLIREGYVKVPKGGVFVLDCLSKFNIHRFMNLLDALRIPHVVLYDQDGNTRFHRQINDLIEKSANGHTLGIDSFSVFIEDFLGMETPAHGATSKPEHLMLALLEDRISRDRVTALVKKIEALVNS